MASLLMARYIEGWKEGWIEGRQEEIIKFQEGIIKILEDRFASISDDICQSIQSVKDFSELNRLLLLAYRCATLDEFTAGL